MKQNYAFYVKLLLVGLLYLVVSVTAFGQKKIFVDGVQKGVVKVKFAPTMSTKLSDASIKTKNGKLAIGITSFDHTASNLNASSMHRLFPYDPKYEDRLVKHGLHLWYLIHFDNQTDPELAASTFKKLKDVVAAECSYEKIIAPHTITPYVESYKSTSSVLPFNDPYLRSQWHYQNMGQNGYPGGADVNLFRAWNITAGASDIIIAIHDQGVDVDHVDLKDNIWVNKREIPGNGIDDDGNGYIDDVNGFNFETNSGKLVAGKHGTHVAGTIAAINNNGIGVAGIAGGTGRGDGVKIMSLQIISNNSLVNGVAEQTYIYAANNGAVISQNSWGYNKAGAYEQSVLDAIDYFIAEAGNYENSPMKGGLVIFAAGNDNKDDLWYPPYYDKVLSVASIAPDWKKASYSNFGEWVNLSAPGGEFSYGSSSGVLSTVLNHQYGYMEGTSMACPHVAGIAALALANRERQMTNIELWNKIVTGVRDINFYNPDYIDKLGTGAIDAELVIRNDKGIVPKDISSLILQNTSQQEAKLKWLVPLDEDDDTPLYFNIYYSPDSITNSNWYKAAQIQIKNKYFVGDTITYDVTGLVSSTKYYFAIKSQDRWGNISKLSNIVAGSTTLGSKINIDIGDADSIELTLDAVSSLNADKLFYIENESEGILRWECFVRNREINLLPTALKDTYVTSDNRSIINVNDVIWDEVKFDSVSTFRNTELTPYRVTSAKTIKSQTYTGLNAHAFICDRNMTLTNSSATRFEITDEDGFNLTNASFQVRYKMIDKPLTIEIYEGQELNKANLIYTQIYGDKSKLLGNNQTVSIAFDKRLYFENGSFIWFVVHVPPSESAPLVAALEINTIGAKNSFISNNYGKTWISLENAISENYAWSVVIYSTRADADNSLNVSPSSGTISGYGSTPVSLTANASNLQNGTYLANLIFTSNDASVPEYKVPVSLIVKNQPAQVVHPLVVDFEDVQIGEEKTVNIVLENIGLGNTSALNVSVDNFQYEIMSATYISKIAALSEEVISVKYIPTANNSANGILKVCSADGKYSYTIHLAGTGLEPSKIKVTPVSQEIGPFTIGDIANAKFQIVNTGKYPLKYFIPQHDKLGISNDWSKEYNDYGYTIRSSKDNENPLLYSFQDIAESGVDITDYFKQSTSNWYYEVDMGFLFPFYGDNMESIYITRKGFTTFDNTINPSAVPKLNMSNTPRGYISLFGFYSVDLKKKGKIYYKTEPEKVIIQYTNMWRGTEANPEMNCTGQIVLFSNGDIRLYYKQVTGRISDIKSAVVLIESLERKDGIILSSTGSPILLENMLALGLDYPGPNILKNIENGSGVVAAGDTMDVDISLETSLLNEGLTTRCINVISNDPTNYSEHVLVDLNVTSGGIAKSSISKDSIDFGNVFENALKSDEFLIKNIGSASLNILDISSQNNKFNISSIYPILIKPGLYEKVKIDVPTSSLVSLQDNILIRYDNGSTDTVFVKANILAAPDIDLDLSNLTVTTDINNILSYPFNIKNTGASMLDFSVIGNEWINFIPETTNTNRSYISTQYNNGDSYEWIDIRITGKRIPNPTDENDMNQFWQQIDIPFTFDFYGTQYNSLKISMNGVITFGNDDPQSLNTPVNLPLQYDEAFVFPFWINGKPDIINYENGVAGIFYQTDENKLVISWEYLMNFLNLGSPISVQAVLYKSGEIKFQYKLRGSLDYNANYATIGIQKEGKSDYQLISRNQSLEYGTGLSIVISPDKSYQVEPDEVVIGKINLNSNNVLGGIYNRKLLINTNVPGKEIQEKSINFTVNGVPAISVTDTIDFGKIMYNGVSILKEKEFIITNSGSASLILSDVIMLDGAQNIDVEIIGAISSSVIKPGESLTVKVEFTPEAEIGEFEDKIAFITNMGMNTVVVKGITYKPAKVDIKKDSINVRMSYPTEDICHLMKMGNIGNSPLEYDISVEYIRNTTSDKDILNKQSSLYSTEIINQGYREIKYLEDSIAKFFHGTDGKSFFTAATKFNPGQKSFNVSHIKTYFRTDKSVNSIINIDVELRAGGNSLADAAVIAKGSLSLYPTEVDSIGRFYTIALENTAEIYPNEDFYIVVVYPLEIANPQGCSDDSSKISGRYFYMTDDAIWRDINDLNLLYPNTAWLMSAIETEPKSSGWLCIKSEEQGGINVCDSAMAELHFLGDMAKRGLQSANIIISTNDPDNDIIKIPATLYINQAPIFERAPKSINILEGITNIYEIPVIDLENDSFTIQALSVDDIVSYNIDGSKLTLTISPKYGDAGIYSAKFIATDTLEASSELNIVINVIKNNRPPVYVGPSKFIYNLNNSIFEYNINDLFADPDGDNITFSAISQNEDIVAVSQLGINHFVVKPIGIGTTYLSFTVKDIHGALVIHSIEVLVRSCVDSKGIIMQKGNNMLYINNTYKKSKVEDYQWYKNGQPLLNEIGQKYVVNEGLDFKAEYMARLATSNDTIYTCPYNPIPKEVWLKVYPNPIERNGQIKVISDHQNLENKTLIIRLITLSGLVLKRIVSNDKETLVDMPSEAGVYLLEITNGSQEKVFRIVVM